MPPSTRVLGDEPTLILEGHWSHAIPGVQYAIVLRTRPRLLRRRLARRRWPARKVAENVEAEALDVILQESVQELGARKVAEIDTSGKTVAEVTRIATRLLSRPPASFMGHHPGRIDFSSELDMRPG